jgi:hypothetical protein
MSDLLWLLPVLGIIGAIWFWVEKNDDKKDEVLSNIERDNRLATMKFRELFLRDFPDHYQDLTSAKASEMLQQCSLELSEIDQIDDLANDPDKRETLIGLGLSLSPSVSPEFYHFLKEDSDLSAQFGRLFFEARYEAWKTTRPELVENIQTARKS